MRTLVAVNVAEAIDADEASLSLALSSILPDARRRTAIDGRMLPHEWLVASSGLWKVDALDHADDDFFPGHRDSAWDVAAERSLGATDEGRRFRRLRERYRRSAAERMARLSRSPRR